MPFGKRLLIATVALAINFCLIGFATNKPNQDKVNATKSNTKVYTSSESDPIIYTFTDDQKKAMIESKQAIAQRAVDDRNKDIEAFFAAIEQEQEQARIQREAELEQEQERKRQAAQTTTTVLPLPTSTTTPTSLVPAYSGGGNGDPNDMASWDRLAQCESNGNWHINTGNGYYGGIQFSLSSWRAVGGTGYPHEHSREEQIRKGQALWQSGGWNHWPGCTSSFGWR